MNPIHPITIVIADDHKPFRTRFRKIMNDAFPGEIAFIAEAANGIELVEQVARYRPRIVLADIRMPLMDGIEASKIIRQQYPESAIIALSVSEDLGAVMNMLQAGVNGYLVKSSPKEEVMEAIRTVNGNGSYYCNTITEQMSGAVLSSRQCPEKNKKITFSGQEEKVMELICAQLSTKEIAGKMALATRTVENYRQKIMQKTGAKNAVGIALSAVANGIAQLAEFL